MLLLKLVMSKFQKLLVFHFVLADTVPLSPTLKIYIIIMIINTATVFFKLFCAVILKDKGWFLCETSSPLYGS